MVFFEVTPKKVKPVPPQTPVSTPTVSERPKYSEIKRCVMKRESGEMTEECKKVFEKAGIND